MAYLTSGVIGATLGTTTTDAKFKLKTLGLADNGQRWMYVYASAAITQYNYVCIDENGYAASGTKALVDAGHAIGFAQVAFAAADYGWVAIEARGDASVNVAASCAADVALYTTASAGVLDDASSSQTLIAGTVIVATVTTAASAEVIATFPRGL